MQSLREMWLDNKTTQDKLCLPLSTELYFSVYIPRLTKALCVCIFLNCNSDGLHKKCVGFSFSTHISN